MKRIITVLMLFIMTIMFASCSQPNIPVKEKPLIIVHSTGNASGLVSAAGKEVAKKFGINALYIAEGCNVDLELKNKIKEQNIKNEKAYKYYEKELGENWKKEFDKALEKEMLIQAKHFFTEK